MRRNVYDYFIDLENKNLTDKHNVYCPEQHKIDFVSQEKSNIILLKIDYLPLYMKKWKNTEGIFSLSSSIMYHKIGVLTPPMKPAIVNIQENDKHKKINEIFMQDAKSLGMYCIEGNHSELIKEPILKNHPKNDWDILYNPEYKETFLKYMTENCFEEFINIFLLAQLRADDDIHFGNFMFYRRYSSPKFEGVIALDLDESLPIDMKIKNKEDFNSVYLENKFFTFTPCSNSKLMANTYKNRITLIRKLIQDGKLTNDQIELIRNALKFNLPQTIKSMCQKYSMNKETKKNTYTPISYLWDYNRKTIGRELGM